MSALSHLHSCSLHIDQIAPTASAVTTGAAAVVPHSVDPPKGPKAMISSRTPVDFARAASIPTERSNRSKASATSEPLDRLRPPPAGRDSKDRPSGPAPPPPPPTTAPPTSHSPSIAGEGMSIRGRSSVSMLSKSIDASIKSTSRSGSGYSKDDNRKDDSRRASSSSSNTRRDEPSSASTNGTKRDQRDDDSKKRSLAGGFPLFRSFLPSSHIDLSSETRMLMFSLSCAVRSNDS